MKKRNIPVSILLSVVTCGIYGIIWFLSLHDTATALADPPKKTSSGVALLLTLVTCGIYGFFWAYNMGGMIDTALTKRNQPATNHAVLYVVLSVVGLSVVAWAMMQNDLNTMLPD